MNDAACDPRALRPATLCVHGGAGAAGAPLVPPLVRSSTFVVDAEVYAARAAGRADRTGCYTRETTPTIAAVEARLARLLLEQAEGESVQRRRWATQAEMASRLGTVPDVVNRALRKLSDGGLIHVERHQIQILDKEGLKTVAQTAE